MRSTPSVFSSSTRPAALRLTAFTSSATTGMPASVPTVSVAASVDGTVSAAAVFDPTHDELWTATVGGGAARNGVALSLLAGDDDVATALVATGFSYQAARRAEQGAVVAALLPAVRDVRRALPIGAPWQSATLPGGSLGLHPIQRCGPARATV